MTKFRGVYRVESARMPGWDYASAAWYAVTICTQNRACTLGGIVDGVIHLTRAGEIIAEEWVRTEQLRPDVTLDEWVIMPNHLHGIVAIGERPPSSSRASGGCDEGETAPRGRLYARRGLG